MQDLLNCICYEQNVEIKFIESLINWEPYDQFLSKMSY